MKMKWEKSRIDIYKLSSADVIAVSGDDPNYEDDDLGDGSVFPGQE